MTELSSVWVIAGLSVLAVLAITAMIARMYRKVGPHEALIIYGFRDTRIIKGGGTIIFPMVEQCKELSLELMSFDVAPQQSLYTNQGVAVTVEAVAQLKVKSDPVSIRTAAEQFLTKRPEQREGLIRLVMEGHLRGIIGQLTVEQIVKEPEMVGGRMRSTCAEDMSKMGLEVVSFTIKEVRDKNEYITNMGRPDIARIKRDAPRPPALRQSPKRKPTRNASLPKPPRLPSKPRPSATSTSKRPVISNPPKKPRRRLTRPTKSKPTASSRPLWPSKCAFSRSSARPRSKCKKPKSPGVNVNSSPPS